MPHFFLSASACIQSQDEVDAEEAHHQETGNRPADTFTLTTSFTQQQLLSSPFSAAMFLPVVYSSPYSLPYYIIHTAPLQSKFAIQ